MLFELSARAKDLQGQLQAFMAAHVYPSEARFYRELAEPGDRWRVLPVIEELKAKAKAAGLWNLFLPESSRGAGLTNLEYAPLCEIMGRVPFAAEVFNCSAPDTGNMEVLERYGTEEHKQKWLAPLLAGEIRSAFCMTEPDVASSDATNIQTRIRREGNEWVIDGKKHFITNAAHPLTKLLIVMGLTSPDRAEAHRRQSMVLVPKETPSSLPRPWAVWWVWRWARTTLPGPPISLARDSGPSVTLGMS